MTACMYTRRANNLPQSIPHPANLVCKSTGLIRNMLHKRAWAGWEYMCAHVKVTFAYGKLPPWG